MQWKLPDDAGVAELNGGDTAGKERELDRSPSGSKQWKAVRSSASEGLEIRRIFSAGYDFDSFSVLSPRCGFFVSFQYFSFRPVLAYHHVVTSLSSGEFVFDSILCFSVL